MVSYYSSLCYWDRDKSFSPVTVGKVGKEKKGME